MAGGSCVTLYIYTYFILQIKNEVEDIEIVDEDIKFRTSNHSDVLSEESISKSSNSLIRTIQNEDNNVCSKQFENIKEDKFDVIGKNLANKLRELPDDVAIVTEKMLYDIIFEANMGNVTKFTKIMLHDTSNQITHTIASTPILQTVKKPPNKVSQTSSVQKNNSN